MEVVFTTTNPENIRFYLMMENYQSDSVKILTTQKVEDNAHKIVEPADATSCAVELLFVLIIVELAVKAEVLRVKYHEKLLNFIY